MIGLRRALLVLKWDYKPVCPFESSCAGCLIFEGAMNVALVKNVTRTSRRIDFSRTISIHTSACAMSRLLLKGHEMASKLVGPDIASGR